MPKLQRPSAVLSMSCSRQSCRVAPTIRSFSTTSPHKQRPTRERRAMFRWLATHGEKLKTPLPGSTNYLSAYNKDFELKRVVYRTRGNPADGQASERDPSKRRADGSMDKALEGSLPPEGPQDLYVFPMNPSFRSERVLSEELRNEIWDRIMMKGQTVREVSAQLSVEMSRVGAVVRLKEVEKEWLRIGKPLAKPYAEAVMAMLPKTETIPEVTRRPHESINDLPVHGATGQQIFLPTSESKHFTREDAARVFSETLLPADRRVPHPELTIMHKELMAGLSEEERLELANKRAQEEVERRQRALAREAKKESAIKKADTGRWEFRFREINVDDAGKNGRGPKGVGYRYGVPHMDRSRGRVKIPTSVE